MGSLILWNTGLLSYPSQGKFREFGVQSLQRIHAHSSSKMEGG